ncbi:TIGR00645 family protein [Crenobacter cavernae]|uniref:TIGR00645 family protein n=1 Tax=Crenobacter cavernae TaxID=2290923 RepID=UPI00196B9CD5|nr:TIGR00645 family protein [Crenobacter cavernae]
MVQGVYAYKFIASLWHLLSDLDVLSETEIMLSVLGLIDVVMIANLLLMVTVGGYETFVSRLRIDNHPDQPEWLSHVNASVLKVKLSMAIISISSIHLLQTFINASKLSPQTMMWQLLIHLGFLVSAAAIAYTDKLLYSTLHSAPASPH